MRVHSHGAASGKRAPMHGPRAIRALPLRAARNKRNDATRHCDAAPTCALWPPTHPAARGASSSNVCNHATLSRRHGSPRLIKVFRGLRWRCGYLPFGARLQRMTLPPRRTCSHACVRAVEPRRIEKCVDTHVGAPLLGPCASSITCTVRDKAQRFGLDGDKGSGSNNTHAVAKRASSASRLNSANGFALHVATWGNHNDKPRANPRNEACPNTR